MTVGYSGTPLPKKLGIKPGMSMAVLNAPANLDAILGELPDGVATSRGLGYHRDLVLIFVTRQADFASQIPALITAIAPDGMIWVAWPKRASKIETDMTEDARAWERGVDELAEEDPEVADYVRSLEEAKDLTDAPEASGDAIAREFERYLRRRGDDPPRA